MKFARNTLNIQAKRKAVAPRKRDANRASDDEHLRKERSNKRALDKSIAQIARGQTVTFDPRKLEAG